MKRRPAGQQKRGASEVARVHVDGKPKEIEVDEQENKKRMGLEDQQEAPCPRTPARRDAGDKGGDDSSGFDEPDVGMAEQVRGRWF